VDRKQLRALLEDGRDGDALRLLEGEPDKAALELLQSIREVKDPELRFFVAWAARSRFGPASADLLADIAKHDPHPDVRSEAMNALLEMSPERASEFWPRLRRQLRSKDEWDAELAGWKLLRLRDPLLSQEIAEILPRWPAKDYIHKSFRVLEWCIDGRVDEIVAHIRGHDHDHMMWLTSTGFYLDCDDIWSAVAWAAENAPDEQCRDDCAHALKLRQEKLQAARNAPHD
jgi:hypothetical protein